MYGAFAFNDSWPGFGKQKNPAAERAKTARSSTDGGPAMLDEPADAPETARKIKQFPDSVFRKEPEQKRGASALVHPIERNADEFLRLIEETSVRA